MIIGGASKKNLAMRQSKQYSTLPLTESGELLVADDQPEDQQEEENPAA